MEGTAVVHDEAIELIPGILLEDSESQMPLPQVVIYVERNNIDV